MAAQKQDDQLERTFSSYVRIQDVVLKTYLGRWTIGRSGERGSGISVLLARYDDDDDFNHGSKPNRYYYSGSEWTSTTYRSYALVFSIARVVFTLLRPLSYNAQVRRVSCLLIGWVGIFSKSGPGLVMCAPINKQKFKILAESLVVTLIFASPLIVPSSLTV